MPVDGLYVPFIITAVTVHEAYSQALAKVHNHPQFVTSPRGLKCHEVMNLVLVIQQPESEPIITKDEKRNQVLSKYFAEEKELYDQRTKSVHKFASASKFWTRVANPDGTVNSAYGYLIWQRYSLGNPEFEQDRGGHPVMRTPWQWVMASLKADQDTRQAVLVFAQPDHYYAGNRDQVCTLQGIFHIRDNRLNLTMTMRSNDLVRGMAFDIPWFISLMDMALDELRPLYKFLIKGVYTHIVHSAHIYASDFAKVGLMLGHQDVKSPTVDAP